MLMGRLEPSCWWNSRGPLEQVSPVQGQEEGREGIELARGGQDGEDMR